MHNFKNLKIWKNAMNLAENVYKVTFTFSHEEIYGLRSQLRRSAVSIATNIAEGAGRNSDKEFRNFLGIANGSSNELFTHILLSQRLKLIATEDAKPLLEGITEIQKMNYSLRQKMTLESS